MTQEEMTIEEQAIWSAKIIKWFKEKHYSQGDSYSVRRTKKRRWAVRYTNDYPMQHGSGLEYILTEQDFKEVIAINL